MEADRSGQVSSAGCLSSTSEDEDEKAEKVIDKAWVILVQCMNPEPIFDCASDLFEHHEIRDMKEKLNTSEKNRSLCDNVRRKGRQGYDKLKDWLARTEQQELVEILECIEDGNDYTKLLESLHKKIEDEMGKESLEDKACAKMKSVKMLPYACGCGSSYEEKANKYMYCDIINNLNCPPK